MTPPVERCVHGHKRTRENVGRNGSCKRCDALRKRGQRSGVHELSLDELRGRRDGLRGSIQSDWAEGWEWNDIAARHNMTE
ncbi:MAG: hypothetical protein ACREMY_05080, partial [bacterium]